MKYSKLKTQLESACPGCEIRIGDCTDKSTWEIIFPESATDEQKAAAQAVLDAAEAPLDYTPERQWTPYEFYSKFTSTEKAALLASTDAAVIEFRQNMQLYQVVYPDSEEMQSAMSYLVSIGILTATRKQEILA